MPRYLLVANQTLGGAELDTVLRERIDRGEARFVVLVPATEPELETDLWMPADPLFTLPPVISLADSDALREARERSERRLDRIVGHIRELGGVAEGRIGAHDPLTAVAEVVEAETFDEVIVSTLPPGISRWLKMDLPSRIDRMVTAPVIVVEAEPSS